MHPPLLSWAARNGSAGCVTPTCCAVAHLEVWGGRRAVGRPVRVVYGGRPPPSLQLLPGHTELPRSLRGGLNQHAPNRSWPRSRSTAPSVPCYPSTPFSWLAGGAGTHQSSVYSAAGGAGQVRRPELVAQLALRGATRLPSRSSLASPHYGGVGLPQTASRTGCEARRGGWHAKWGGHTAKSMRGYRKMGGGHQRRFCSAAAHTAGWGLGQVRQE